MKQMSWVSKWLLYFTNKAIIMVSRILLWPSGTQISKEVDSPVTESGGTAARILRLKLYNSYPGNQQWSSHILWE